jgi:4'-phosphopantetheinyl transferase
MDFAEGLSSSVVPNLGSDVHIWIVDLRVAHHTLNQLCLLLSEEELQRRRKYHSACVRNRALVSRASLRCILSKYTGLCSNDIEFFYSASGKPGLNPHQSDLGLQFNVAHSEDLALIAVTIGSVVGVDLEQVHEVPDALEVAKHLFPPAATKALLELPAKQLSEAFLESWTRLEACVKATGLGLANLMDGNDGGALLSLNPGWLIHSFVPALGYVAAIATPKEHCNLRAGWWRFDD